MKRPYDYINGNIIDVNNPIHQKIVIQRNKKLESAKTNGLLIGDSNVKVSVNVELDCPNCGKEIMSTDTLDSDKIFDQVIENVPKTLKCECCNSLFRIYQDSYRISTPKPVLK